MFDVMKVAKKIKEARIAKNMTQMQLAEEMEVSYQAVSGWERGNSMPDISKLEQLCRVLEISIDELLGAESSGQAVKKVASGEMEQELTLEELQEVAPLLPPNKVKNYAEETIKKSKKTNLSAIIPLAPFLSEEALDELLQDVEDADLKELVGLAPFLSEETLDKLALKADVENIDKINGLLPFLSEDTLDKLIVKRISAGQVDSLEEFYPFLEEDTLKKIAKAMMKAGDMKGLQNLMPFC